MFLPLKVALGRRGGEEFVVNGLKTRRREANRAGRERSRRRSTDIVREFVCRQRINVPAEIPN